MDDYQHLRESADEEKRRIVVVHRPAGSLMRTYQPIIQVDGDGALWCPSCLDSVYTHVDEAVVAGRHEDQPVVGVEVNSFGEVTDVTNGDIPAGRVGSGRSHRIVLKGYCEMCGARFAFVFTQRKGATLVETVPLYVDGT